MMSVAGTRTPKAGKEKPSKSSVNNMKFGSDGKTPENPNPKIQPTAEQMRLAQMINDAKESDDPELELKIRQVMELTNKNRDAAIVALHDSDNDPNRAIDMLLEGDADQGEWETSCKKKKNRQQNSVPRPTDANNTNNTVNNKENRNRTERNRDSEKEQDGSRNRGPPRLSRGGPPNRSWRGREHEKNERNLEDSRSRDRSSDGRGRGRMMNGPGRGRGRGGPRSRTFQNRGTNHGSFPKSIDTWTNSTAEQVESGSGDNTMNVGSWSDSFPPTEEWENEDWTGSLAETKVFTPSVSVSSTVPPLQDSTNTSQSIDLAVLLQKPVQTSDALSSSLPTTHSQFLSQFNQQATETLKSVVGISQHSSLGQTSPVQTAQAIQALNDQSGGSGSQAVIQPLRLCGTSSQQALPQRAKSSRTKLPPPSKIPSSAVEMPDDAVTSLDVQFGGLEFGSESAPFEFPSVEVSTFQSSTGSVSASVSTHITSMASTQSGSIGNSVLSTQVTASNLSKPVVTEGTSRAAFTSSHSVASNKEIPQVSNLSQSTLSQNSLTHTTISSSSLTSSQKHSGSDLIPFSSQNDRKVATPFTSQRSSQATGIDAAVISKQNESSGLGTSFVNQNSHSSNYQSNYQSQKTSSTFSSHKPTSSSFSHASLTSHQTGIVTSQNNIAQTGLSTSQTQSGYSSASVSQTQVSFSGTSSVYQAQAPTSFSTTVQSTPSYQVQTTSATFTPQSQNSFPSQTQTSFGSHQSSNLGQSNSYSSQTQSSAYGSQSNYGSTSVTSAQSHTALHASPITTSKLSNSLSSSVKDGSLDSSSQHSYDSCHPTTSSTSITVTLTTTTTTSGLSSGNVNVTSALGLSSSTTTPSSTSSTSKTSMMTGKTGLPNIPPGVPAVLGHQYIMGQAGLPFYGLQQPVYSYEDIQMLQQRLPLAGYYDIAFQPPSSITGRDSGLANVAYSSTDGKFSRGDNASPVPTTLSQQQTTTQQHQQPFINPATLTHGYGYYYAGGMVPGSFPQYGTPIFPMPPVTNATTNSQFQKPAAYASHAYSSDYHGHGGHFGVEQNYQSSSKYHIACCSPSEYHNSYTVNGNYKQLSVLDNNSKGYDNLNQTQDYKGYGSGSQSQSKGVGGSSSTTGGSGSATDYAGSLYKTHSQIGKSFDKPGFHAGTPPPFNLPGTQTGPMGAPSTPYAPPPFIAMMTHHQQHPSPLLHHQLHPDSQNTNSQRSNQSVIQQKPSVASKQTYSTNYWTSN